MINRKITGFGFGLLASFFGVFTGIAVKWLHHEIPTVQVLFIRFLIGFLIMLPIVIKKEGSLKVALTPWVNQILRAVSGLIGVFCCYHVITKINFTDFMVVGRVHPLIMIGLSLFFLKEKAGSKKVFAAFLAVLGALIAIKPNLSSPLLYILLVFFGISLCAFGDIFVKKLTVTESCEKIALCFFGIGALILLCMMPFVWVTPTSISVLIPLLTIGVSGLLSQYFMIKSYNALSAGTLGLLSSSQLIWAVIFGASLWGEAMGIDIFIGMFLIFFSSVLGAIDLKFASHKSFFNVRNNE